MGPPLAKPVGRFKSSRRLDGDGDGDPLQGQIDPPPTNTPPTGPPTHPPTCPPHDHPHGPADDSTCESLLGEPVNWHVVSGNQSQVDLPVSENFAIRVAGNQSTVNINVESEDGSGIQTLCLRATGNHSQIQVNINTTVQNIHYRATGHSTNASIVVNSGSSVDGLFNTQLFGNQQSLDVSGEGTYACPTQDIRGNGSSVTCSE